MPSVSLGHASVAPDRASESPEGPKEENVSGMRASSSAQNGSRPLQAVNPPTKAWNRKKKPPRLGLGGERVDPEPPPAVCNLPYEGDVA